MSDVAAREFLGQLANHAKQREREQSTRVYAGTNEAFRWARVDGRTQHFQPQARSGNSAIYESEDLMGRRVRDQLLNNSQIKKITDTLVDLIVGCGMQTFSDPLDPAISLDDLIDGEFEDELQFALEADELFEDWFQDPKRFSARGKLAGPDCQRLAMRECVSAGSVLALECFKKGPDGEPDLCYQLIEREQLDHSQDRPAGAGQNKIVHGIEFDEYDTEIAFHVLDSHPHDAFGAFSGSSKSRRIEANRVIHLALFSRPSDTLGVNWLASCGQNVFDRDKFIGNEIQVSAKSALLMLAVFLKNLKAGNGGLGLDDGDVAEDAYGNQEFKLSSSPLAFRLGADDKLELLESARPIATADSFINILDHDTAGGVGLSSYSVTGRYDKSNFTSVRGALLAEDAHIKPVQQWFARDFAIPIRRRFQQLAILRRKLKSVSVADYLADPRKYSRFEALGSGRDLLDPSAETEAALGRLRGCLSTLKLECAKRGLHWIRVLRQAAWENRVASKLSIVLDFSKGQGSAAQKTTREDGAADDSKPAERRAPAPKKTAKNRRAG